MENLNSLPKYKNLVFEGGGVKGIAYGGALIRLEELGYLETIGRVAGTSAGAITAILMAIGYSSKEISDIISQTNFNDFADDDIGLMRDFYRLFRFFGWHRGDKFKDWISELISQKLGKPDISFSELHSLVKTNPKLKDLYVVGSNLTKQASEIYSYETNPGMSINQAVRISMSIPFYFQAVSNMDISKFKEILVDGGVIRNYPIDLFDHKKYLSDPANGDPNPGNPENIILNTGPDYVFNHETLGFRLTDRDSLEANLNGQKITNIKDFSWSLIVFMRSMASKLHVQEDDWNRTVAIDTTGVGVTEFDLSQEKINMLINNGSKGVDGYFEWLQSSYTQISFKAK